MPPSASRSPASDLDLAPWLSAADAAALLGVQRSSLYSYVSRGLLTAQPVAGRRGSQFLRADVARLAAQRRAVRNPARVAQSALDWGQPVLHSAITLVRNGRLSYRGHDALAWAQHASLEDTACLLWQQAPPHAHKRAHTALAQAAGTGTDAGAGAHHGAEAGGQAADERDPVTDQAHAHTKRPIGNQNAQVQARAASQVEAQAADASALRMAQLLARWHAAGVMRARVAWPDAGALREAWQLLPEMCHALLGYRHAAAEKTAVDEAYPLNALDAMHCQLARHWGLDGHGASLVRWALVVSADHELNASSFAVRVVASSGASLHASVGAGLAALSGPLHGGVTAVIDRHWDDWHAHADLAPSLLAFLAQARAGNAPSYCAGFGHPLYPQGDPRAAALLQALAQTPAIGANANVGANFSPSAAHSLLARVQAHTGLLPSLDYALVAIQRALNLPAGSAFVLFALGRTVGWIAHALEQHASGQLIRPRAVYTGPEPDERPAHEAAASPLVPHRVVRF